MEITHIWEFAKVVIFPILLWFIKLQSDKAEANTMRISELKEDLFKYKVEVAQTYAANATVASMEEKILSRLDRLDGKIDSKLQRNPNA